MADKIKGNTDGLKAALIREYEQYLGCQCGPGEYVPAELTAAMAKFTGETGREIAFVLDRRNYVREISVGDAVHVDTQLNDGKQRGLSGTRLLHTHPNGTYTASAQDLETLRRCRLDAMVAIGVDGAAVTGVSVYLIDPEDAENNYLYFTKQLYRDKVLVRSVEKSSTGQRRAAQNLFFQSTLHICRMP